MPLASAALPLAGIGGLATTAKQMFDVTIRRRWTTTITLPPLCFYLHSSSIIAGDVLGVHAHCPLGASLSVSRLGIDRTTDQPVLTTEINPTRQCGSYDYWRGFSWPAMKVATDQSWTPGLYVVEVSSGSERYRQALIVSAPDVMDVCVILPTNTWAAYNQFGGLSNYGDSATPRPLRELYRLARVTNSQIVLGER